MSGNSTTSSKTANSPKTKAKSSFVHTHHHHSHHHHHQPKIRSKSFTHTATNSPPMNTPPLSTPPNSQQMPSGPLQMPKQRRASSFTSTSSPWFRRKSFLSASMMSNDKSSIYELSSYSYDHRVPTFTMSLKESQGFIFNQDLFASQYQQSRVILQDDNQGVILKDLRNDHSSYDWREENEDYGIETTDVFVDTDDE